MRLSLPGEESKPFKIKNGDAIQFGVDRRGSNEADMTCVGTWAKHRNTQDGPAASSDGELLGGVGWAGTTTGVRLFYRMRPSQRSPVRAART